MFNNLVSNIKSSFYLKSLPTPNAKKYNCIGIEPLVELYYLFYCIFDDSNPNSSFLAKNKNSRTDLICLLHSIAHYCNKEYNKIYDDKYKEKCRARFSNNNINFNCYYNPSCRSFKYASQVLLPHTISPTNNINSHGLIPREILDRVSLFDYVLSDKTQGLSKFIQFASNIVCFDYTNNTFHKTNSTEALINPINAEIKAQLEVSTIVYSLLDTISASCKECVEKACNIKFSDNETISFEPHSSARDDISTDYTNVLETQIVHPNNEPVIGTELDINDYIYCTKCGTKLPNDCIYCMKCGSKIPRI